MIVYAMKVKVCSSCDKTGPLWKSSPALCKDCAMRIKAKESRPFSFKGEPPIVNVPTDEPSYIIMPSGNVYSVRVGKYETSSIKKKPVKTHKDEYKEFFESLTIPERCEECNQQLLAFNNFGRRACSAHILPKSKFKSVAKHPDNILFMGASLLGACDCHDKWDRSIDSRKSMRVYQRAVDRIYSLRNLLTDKEIISAQKYLGI